MDTIEITAVIRRALLLQDHTVADEQRSVDMWKTFDKAACDNSASSGTDGLSSVGSQLRCGTLCSRSQVDCRSRVQPDRATMRSMWRASFSVNALMFAGFWSQTADRSSGPN